MTRERALLWVIWIMLVLYSLPIYGVVVAAVLSNGFNQAQFILPLFSSLVATGDDSYSIFHRVLIPLIAGFSVIAFRDDRNARVTLLLITFILLSVITAIGLNLYLSSAMIKDRVAALKPYDFDSGQARAFFNRLQEVLGTLLMLLLGLKAEATVQLKREE